MARHHHEALTSAEKSLHDQSNLLPRRQLVSCLGILALALLISFVDQNGISTALPTIAADLDARATISWAGTASLLANTTFQMLYGRLSDIFGRKAVFVAAVLLLALADLLCGLSSRAALFYVWRGVAGIGGGGITNLSMIIVSDVVTLEQRGRYQGITGSMIGLGSVTGPLLAAAFVESRATWRGLFWVLAPLGALNGLLAYLYLPSKEPTATVAESVKKVDWMGSLTSSVGTIFLLIPISGGGAYFPWNSPMAISMLAIGSLSLVLFVLVEWKLAKLPMMPVAVYRNPVVVVLLAQSFVLGLVYQAAVYYTPLYLQNAHQFSIIVSALLLVPMFAAQSIASTLSGFLISRYKRYGVVIRFGFGMWTLGAGLALIYTRQTNSGIIVIPLLVMGIGVGCVFQPTLVALQAHSAKSRRAVIISNRNFNRCAGGACGLAISAAVLQARLRARLPPEYAYLAASTYALPVVPEGLPPAVLDAYMAASRAVFVLQVPLIGLCFLGTIFVQDRGLARKHECTEELSLEQRDEERGDAAVRTPGRGPRG
ncbi:putative transporter C3H1.06c [Tolypocladium ophioglossoides CBS 100239]|uniref:Putative transporter C3H1.06c n=1 Tax=Tolypocladium ophioglossoides (strain CBS 100239) TaxID=1163406 RepID=A0A0L0N7M1_TOLOC|nr:putative transporter C3H1.06c [Tolypocladium ophioglossoides CBS 100239]